MDIQVTQAGQEATIVFKGSFAIAVAQRVRKTLQAVLQKGAKTLTIDFSGVDYIDSSSIATFIELLQKLQANGGSMRIVGASTRVREIFDLMGLTPLFAFD